MLVEGFAKICTKNKVFGQNGPEYKAFRKLIYKVMLVQAKNPNSVEENLPQKVAKYRELTREALEKVELYSPKGTPENMKGKLLLQMAENYFSDAQYFEQEGKMLTALAAYSYAHAWIDAGVRLGLLDGKGDDKLFVLP